MGVALFAVGRVITLCTYYQWSSEMVVPTCQTEWCHNLVHYSMNLNHHGNTSNAVEIRR
jgi:hypothetical protein